MAKLLSCDVNTLIKYENAGTLSPRKKGSMNVYRVWDSIVSVVVALRGIASGRTKDELMQELEQAKLQAEVDLKRARANKAMLEADEAEGKMHRAEDVEAATNEMVFAIRSALLSLPGRLAVDCATLTTPKACSVRIAKEVKAILEELSGYDYDPLEYRRMVSERGNGRREEEDE